MKRNYVYPFGMGKNQKRVILAMCQDDLKIVRFDNLRNNKGDCTLEDDEGNVFEELHPAFVETLVSRKLFTEKLWYPSVDAQIMEWRMKPELIEETILILT